jgi:hypothetical protein
METKFNSQICTTREQSERLLSLGLKTETADCCYYYYDGEYLIAFAEDAKYPSDIPAWSLHRLIEMVAGGSEEQMIFLPDPYDELIEEIAGAIIVGCFPKEYLV